MSTAFEAVIGPISLCVEKKYEEAILEGRAEWTLHDGVPLMESLRDLRAFERLKHMGFVKKRRGDVTRKTTRLIIAHHKTGLRLNRTGGSD